MRQSGKKINKVQLRRVRRLRGYTQQELAQLVGVGSSSLGMYEQGRRNPKRETLRRLCEVLQVSLEDLTAATGTQEQSQELLDEVQLCMKRGAEGYSASTACFSDR